MRGHDPLGVWHVSAGPPRREEVGLRWRNRGPAQAPRWCPELPVLDLDRQRVDWVPGGDVSACRDTPPDETGAG